MGADFFAMNISGIGSKLKIVPHIPKVMKWVKSI